MLAVVLLRFENLVVDDLLYSESLVVVYQLHSENLAVVALLPVLFQEER